MFKKLIKILLVPLFFSAISLSAMEQNLGFKVKNNLDYKVLSEQLNKLPCQNIKFRCCRKEFSKLSLLAVLRTLKSYCYYNQYFYATLALLHKQAPLPKKNITYLNNILENFKKQWDAQSCPSLQELKYILKSMTTLNNNVLTFVSPLAKKTNL